MKSLKYILVLLFALTPLFASAQTIPAFPMALWGAVTINGTAAPIGTIVRAYYGSTLAGQVTVQDVGVYGYTEPTKQKLVLGEGTGALTFTIQSSSFNSAAETGGTTAITYPQFTAGSTVNFDLAFTVSVPAPVSSGGGGGGGGGGGSSGGGGGGGGVVSTPTVTPVATTTTTTNTVVTTSQPPSTPGVVLGASTYNFTQTLQVGSTGNDVTQLQTVLIANGYLNSTATGYFGALTQAALKLYQAKYGISQTGTVGPLTRAQLNKGTTSTTVTTNTTTSVPAASGYVFAQSLKIGSSGSDVTALQNVLIGLGLLQSQATGYFGSLTQKALIAYQAKYGISQTGTVGPLTRAQLNK